MSPPGAARSTVGPKFEYGALVRSGPTDATLITFAQDAGVEGVLELSLPAAATTIAPCARTAAYKSAPASLHGLVSKLRLITLAGCEGRVPESLLNPAA